MYTCRVDAALTTDNTRMQLNGDSGANYNCSVVDGNNNTPSSVKANLQTSMLYVGIAFGTSIASYYATTIIDIPAYTSSVFKSVNGSSSAVSGVATSTFTRNMAGSWASTAAITSISHLTTSNNFVAGSIFYLYGIW